MPSTRANDIQADHGSARALSDSIVFTDCPPYWLVSRRNWRACPFGKPEILCEGRRRSRGGGHFLAISARTGNAGNKRGRGGGRLGTG